MRFFNCIFILFSLCFVSSLFAAERVLTLDEYLRLAVANDTEFQEILIDELLIKYRKDLNLPARDIVLDVAAEYNLFLSQDREEPNLSVGLSKLFPRTGTEISAAYSNRASLVADNNRSDFTVMISQPIAENAFGEVTQLEDQIIGLENDVIRHQVIEAYEDYLSTVILIYLEWYEAYQNLKISESSYQENLKLLDNVKKRQTSSIALPIDVNKIHLQVFAKEESLIDLQTVYDNALNFIEQAIRYAGDDVLKPAAFDQYSDFQIDFEKEFQDFKENSRTFQVLNLLETKSSLDVDLLANELLPSINFILGYKVDGQDWEIESEDNLFFTGFEMEWPFKDQVKEAEVGVAKIEQKRTKLTTENTKHRLYVSLKNLSQQVNREEKLLKIANEKTGLSESVLNDETENYSFGKVTINDYIDAVNVLDRNRFNQVQRDVLQKRLIVQWLRATDQLLKSNGEYFPSVE